MSTYLLEVQARNPKVTRRRLQREALVPGVLYGPGRTPASVQVERSRFLDLIRQAGVHHPIMVRREGGSPELALIKEVQWDLFRPEPLHFDGMLVAADRPVNAEVPVVILGETDLRTRRLVLQQQMTLIPVHALPHQLPEQITLNVAQMNEGDSVTIADLPLPGEVTVRADPQQLVISIFAPAVPLETEEAAEPAGATEPAGAAKEPTE